MVERKINVTTMLNPEDFQRLTDLSRETGKSISSLIREAVQTWLNEKHPLGGREVKKLAKRNL